MRRFLKKILLFSLIIIALLVAGEVVVRRMPTSYSYKHDRMESGAAGVATLVLGSSHTYYGVKSDVLGDSVFNLANVSQTPDIDLLLLRKYLPAMTGLRRVIVPVSYFTFTEPRLEDGDEWFRCISYKTDMDLPGHSDFSKYNFEISDYEGYFAKLKGMVVKQPSNRCDSLGWGLGYTLDSRGAGWQEQGRSRAASTTFPLSGRGDEVERLLGEIIRLCRQRGVECVLVTTPAWHTYREALDARQRTDMMARTRRLADTYGVRYLDFFSDSDFTEEDFHDVDHLSDVGAVRLSNKIKEALNP